MSVQFLFRKSFPIIPTVRLARLVVPPTRGIASAERVVV